MEQHPSSTPSVRVLLRPPPPSAAIPHPPPTNSTPPSVSPAAPLPDGVVVAGFLASGPAVDAVQLANRVLDANVFGSGGLDKDLLASQSNAKRWFDRRRISYYYEEEQGLVFLLFSPSSAPAVLLAESRADGGQEGPASVLQECETEDLQGMLLMFSVCHVIIFLHEGLRFDTNILKKFRMLQSGKHALAPHVRNQIMPMLVPKASSSVPQHQIVASVSPASQVSRRGSVANRHASAITLMSGSSSQPSALPGQCIPVILFVFVDDFLDISSPSNPPNTEDLAEVSSLNQSSSLSGTSRPGLNSKGSGSVVVLARPTCKPDGNFRKKLQSSLEGQIRFLIKKCRILAGTEPSHHSLRGVGSGSLLPLFSLDAIRIVALLDRAMHKRGESLDFVSGLIEESFNSKETADMSMLENHCQTLSNEDIQSIKDFINRQSDMLRGRGGLPSNANSGSITGVGMVAAAAAAAAASAAAGKPVSTPELPTMDKWLSSTCLILEVLLYVKYGLTDENEDIKIQSVQRNATEVKDEQSPPLGTAAVEAAVSCLESRKGLNMKFSTSWCQRALPAAKEVYLKDLPACYPTSLHKTQLERASSAFLSMVKGPAAQFFVKKLENECTLIWESGRQLCDAISLTGKPCMHQRHSGKVSDSSSGTVIKQHSSGYVFLHACACGRSRRLREDPFDFDSANMSFNCFPNCENHLPTLVFPKGSNAGPLPSDAWSLVRLGGAKYYKPLKGLLQIGFCSTEKFLYKWTISLEKRNGMTNLPINVSSDSSVPNSSQVPKIVSVVEETIKKSDASHLPEEVLGGSQIHRKSFEAIASDDSRISFGKGLPSFTMKKSFSVVVAGSAAGDSVGPILQQRKQPKADPENVAMKTSVDDQTADRISVADIHKGSQKTEHNAIHENVHRPGTDSYVNGKPFLQIGSNIVPVNICDPRKIKSKVSLKQVTVYIGFEHECPYGHRFLLSSEHLNELESVYSPPEKSHSFTEANCSQQKDRPMTFSKSAEMLKSINGITVPFDASEDLIDNFSHVSLDDGGPAFSLLNRNLPVYMNCPHCRNSKKDGHQKAKFGSTVSQLQRIFMVTPPFPTALSTCPVVKFDDSCIPPCIPDREQQSQFSPGCRIILPPESFVTLRLPFVYGVRMDDGNLHPLKYHERQPERTAWLNKGTTLQVVSKEHACDEFHNQ